RNSPHSLVRTIRWPGAYDHARGIRRNRNLGGRYTTDEQDHSQGWKAAHRLSLFPELSVWPLNLGGERLKRNPIGINVRSMHEVTRPEETHEDHQQIGLTTVCRSSIVLSLSR